MLATRLSARLAAALGARLRERLGPPSGAPDERFAVDAAYASSAPEPATLAPPPVLAATPDALVRALEASGLGLVDVLLAGFPDTALAPLARVPEESAHAAIERIVRDPAFQLR